MGDKYKDNIAMVSFSFLGNVVIYIYVLTKSDVAILGLLGLVVTLIGVFYMVLWATKSHTFFDEMNVYRHKFVSLMGLSFTPSLHRGKAISDLKVLPKTMSGGKAGYVYVIRELSEGHYKIGRTINPSSRMRTFGLKLPFKIEYLYIIEAFDMYKLESTLHKQFANRRVNGEWFALKDIDLMWIENNCDPIMVNEKANNA